MSLVRALFGAIDANDEERVRELLAYEPRLAMATNSDGLSAVLVACYRQNATIVDALRAAGADLDLFEAAAAGDAGLVAQRISADPAAVSAYTPDGYTALHLAAIFAHADIVRLLLEHGAAANSRSRDQDGLTPLQAAAAAGDAAAAAMLLAQGAQVSARRHDGRTALHEAAGRGDRRLISILLRAGADATLRDDDGETAAQVAVACGHGRIARQIAAYVHTGDTETASRTAAGESRHEVAA
ncbi:MAG: ankyrin repeat domain-containing protein [Thermoleophilia bacterium]